MLRRLLFPVHGGLSVACCSSVHPRHHPHHLAAVVPADITLGHSVVSHSSTGCSTATSVLAAFVAGRCCSPVSVVTTSRPDSHLHHDHQRVANVQTAVPTSWFAGGLTTLPSHPAAAAPPPRDARTSDSCAARMFICGRDSDVPAGGPDGNGDASPPPPGGCAPPPAVVGETESLAHSLSEFLMANDGCLRTLQLLQVLPPEARRQLIVTAGALEWYRGTGNVSDQVRAADADKDNRIGPSDFQSWVEAAVLTRRRYVAPTVLFHAAFFAFVPFVGFGFLDNSVMLLAGDAIDRSIGQWLGLSTMGAAACGAVFSGTLGMQAHGIMARLVAWVIPAPVLTPEQHRNQRVFKAEHAGSTLGIAVGLACGMLPLLFLSSANDGDRRSVGFTPAAIESAFTPVDHHEQPAVVAVQPTSEGTAVGSQMLVPSKHVVRETAGRS